MLAWAGARDAARPTHRALTPAEIVALARGELVSVGRNTVTHPQLSALDAEAQVDEIGRSKAQVEATLGRAVTSFAYPYGGERDYTCKTVALVREAGRRQVHRYGPKSRGLFEVEPRNTRFLRFIERHMGTYLIYGSEMVRLSKDLTQDREEKKKPQEPEES